ncbi:MAG: hypothetical protein ABSC23_21980 [Bryobacteraceae bacterium]
MNGNKQDVETGASTLVPLRIAAMRQPPSVRFRIGVVHIRRVAPLAIPAIS